jgi:hypothetical protein
VGLKWKDLESTHMQFQKMAKFGELAIEVLIDRVKPLLKLPLSQFADGVMCGVVVDVGKENGL